MRVLLTFFCCICFITNAFAQKEKVKGNKIVMTDEKIVDAFHTIELYNNFEVTLQEDSDHIIKIEADSNLQELIDVEIQDSILKIKSDKDLRRAKALNITIHYATELKKIKTYDKVNLTALSPIQTSTLELSIQDQSEVFLTIEANKTNCITYGKASADLHISGTEATYQINENSELKGIVTTDTLSIDLYQKGSAKLEGETKLLKVRTDNDTDFYGEKLVSTKASLLAEGNSDCYIVTNEEIIIEAMDKSEIYLLGDAKVDLSKFSNEATLYKKNIDYKPNRLKLN